MDCSGGCATSACGYGSPLPLVIACAGVCIALVALVAAYRGQTLGDRGGDGGNCRVLVVNT